MNSINFTNSVNKIIIDYYNNYRSIKHHGFHSPLKFNLYSGWEIEIYFVRYEKYMTRFSLFIKINKLLFPEITCMYNFQENKIIHTNELPDFEYNIFNIIMNEFKINSNKFINLLNKNLADNLNNVKFELI